MRCFFIIHQQTPCSSFCQIRVSILVPVGGWVAGLIPVTKMHILSSPHSYSDMQGLAQWKRNNSHPFPRWILIIWYHSSLFKFSFKNIFNIIWLRMKDTIVYWEKLTLTYLQIFFVFFRYRLFQKKNYTWNFYISPAINMLEIWNL